MSEVTEVEGPSAVQATLDVADRRRPGRLENVSPTLIPILRTSECTTEIEFEEVDQIAAARGVAFGALLSAPIWVIIAYVGMWFLS